jgi:hypothetical protein
MSRTIQTVDEMTKALTQDKGAKGRKALYKQQTDEHKGEQLQADIASKITALKVSDARERIDWADLEQVKERTYDYLTACQQAEVYPSIMGLAVYGYGVSRQALNDYLRTHNNDTTAFIERAKDIMADILTNASLYNNANAVQVIFQLKNHFGHSDTVQLQPVAPKEESTFSAADIRARYIEEYADSESNE